MTMDVSFLTSHNFRSSKVYQVTRSTTKTKTKMRVSLPYAIVGATMLVGAASAFSIIGKSQNNSNSLSRSSAVSRGGEASSVPSSSTALQMSSDDFVKKEIEANEVR